MASRIKVHLCKHCGETDPKKFTGRNKGSCTSCDNERKRLKYASDENHRKYHKEKGDRWVKNNVVRSRWLAAKYRALRKGIEFTIDIEYLNELLEIQEHKCAYLDISFAEALDGLYSMSIDRIDSSEGYTKDNVVWVCTIVNSMKNSLSEEEFLEIITKIYKNKVEQ